MVKTGLLLGGLILAVVTLGVSRPAVAPPTSEEAAPRVKPAARWPVTIRKPSGPPTVDSGLVDEKGQSVRIACAICHATKPVNGEARLGTALVQFHQNLVGQHATLTCVSCHNPADGYGTLRLADGKSVPHSEVMTLCAQCHGPQYRDYQHGAHGGMNGYWDLTRGGRTRNNCIDCHDAHAPKIRPVHPAAGPNDRFLNGGGHE